MKDYKGKITFVVKQYPYKYRDYAYISSLAVLSANEQGKFMEMHELLIKKSPKLDKESLISYAKDLGLDANKFKQALEEKKFAHQIEQDLKLAKELDIYNTPTIFINGIKVVGNRDYAYFKKIIDKVLKEEK